MSSANFDAIKHRVTEQQRGTPGLGNTWAAGVWALPSRTPRILNSLGRMRRPWRAA